MSCKKLLFDIRAPGNQKETHTHAQQLQYLAALVRVEYITAPMFGARNHNIYIIGTKCSFRSKKKNKTIKIFEKHSNNFL